MDEHPGKLGEHTDAHPRCDTKNPFHTENGPALYGHVENSTPAELDRLGLTALRAMVDVDPYGSSDLDGDPFNDQPPYITFASSSEHNDPAPPENRSGKKKKKKRKTKRPDGRRSQGAKAIATSEMVVNLPEFTGKDLGELAESFCPFLRMTGQTRASGRVKCDMLLQWCKTKYLEKHVKRIVTKSATFADVLVALERQYSTRDRSFHQGRDPEPGGAVERPQACQDLEAANRLGPLGRAIDARCVRQRRAAPLFGGQAPTRAVG